MQLDPLAILPAARSSPVEELVELPLNEDQSRGMDLGKEITLPSATGDK